ncbi:hypothetical protein [Aminobacter carboxidus]|uniref:Uncharacterized protein n=1 Tax=Aminobacter carboxidus TaxID=376165 RepID=A0ABR9GQS6_9HYPH|nr:hypothetical protein [Aminobacter carboxidus]MBE1205983.1 hypothetical protein [Aminobacter carboxidus]
MTVIAGAEPSGVRAELLAPLDMDVVAFPLIGTVAVADYDQPFNQD